MCCLESSISSLYLDVDGRKKIVWFRGRFLSFEGKPSKTRSRSGAQLCETNEHVHHHHRRIRSGYSIPVCQLPGAVASPPEQCCCKIDARASNVMKPEQLIIHLRLCFSCPSSILDPKLAYFMATSSVIGATFCALQLRGETFVAHLSPSLSRR